jgi:Mg2+ and Co2+ transporter CorA
MKLEIRTELYILNKYNALPFLVKSKQDEAINTLDNKWVSLKSLKAVIEKVASLEDSIRDASSSLETKAFRNQRADAIRQLNKLIDELVEAEK